jgi:hypothetical protein
MLNDATMLLMMSIAVFVCGFTLSQRPMTDALQDPDRLAEYFAFLDAVREGGSINMFAGSVPLRKIYGLDDATAKRVLFAWTKTFDREHVPRWRAEKQIGIMLADG